jgi:hypothetical protein
MPGGRRSCSPHLEVAVTCGSSGPKHRVRPRAARVAMSTVATARATTCPRWRLAAGSRPDTSPGAAGRRHEPGRRHQPSHAWRTPPVGHRPAGRRSFRKQGTVNPPIAPSSPLPLLLQAAPCGRPPNPDGGRARIVEPAGCTIPTARELARRLIKTIARLPFPSARSTSSHRLGAAISLASLTACRGVPSQGGP